MNALVKEAIQIKGQTYYYLPRDVQVTNLVLGEDVISKFSLAVPIEMYLENATGFEGDREMFSKFGLEIRNSFKLTVHVERWETEIKTLFDDNNLNEEALFDIANYIRPCEGDLIYDPMTKFLMEIKFVDHDAEFFSLGKNYKYLLSCEAFQYQQETIATGVAEIDLFQQNNIEIGNTNTPIRESGVDFTQDATDLGLTIKNPFDV